MSGKLPIVLVSGFFVVQIGAMAVAIDNSNRRQEATDKAAAEGRTAFQLGMTFGAFSEPVEMANAVRDQEGKGCSVNLEYKDGTFVTKWNGLILDSDNKEPERVYIDDCSYLLKNLFPTATNG